MNLESNPTVEELASLYQGCDDIAHHHVVYVTNLGEVKVEILIDEPWDVWEEKRNMRFRLEIRQSGNGYVGEVAAKDKGYIKSELSCLIKHWRNRSIGYVDY